MKSIIKKIAALIVMLVLTTSCAGAAVTSDLEIIHTETRTISDSRGTINVRLDFLKRPGEMALTIDYYGYLTQEGLVNFYIDVNGEQREFLTMRQELKNRAQRIRIISYHPVIREDGINRLCKIPDNTLVDGLLFRNAPYYKALGDIKISFIFFAHSRWHGDSSNGNANFELSFTSPIEDFPDHF